MSKIVRDPREGGTGEWADAFRRVSVEITAHPDFPRLVREVAIAEQPGHPRTAWLRRNSLTYAAWADRGMPRVDTGPGRRRARSLAQGIAIDLDLQPSLRLSESTARVYVEALDHVRARLTGKFDGA